MCGPIGQGVWDSLCIGWNKSCYNCERGLMDLKYMRKQECREMVNLRDFIASKNVAMEII